MRKRLAAAAGTIAAAMGMFVGASAVAQPAADLVVLNAKISSNVDRAPARDTEPTALAVKDGLFSAVGDNAQIEAMIGPETVVIDAEGRRIIPGLNDSHIHATRGGRSYNTELRWDGVDSLARGLEMIRLQAKRTPQGQWVRVVGGWSPYQFAEQRLPTPAELTAAAPKTPVFVMFLYSQGYLNKAGVEALGITKDTPAPAGARIEITPDGGAILHAEPHPILLYKTVAALPSLSPEDQLNSSLHFYRELNRFGITSVVDAGGGGHLYPSDYAASENLAEEGGLTVRVGNYLFSGDTGNELEQYRGWTASERIGVNKAVALLEGYTVDGAGENLTAAAADYENFMAPRPQLAAAMERELESITRFLAERKWPIRIHATYDESIDRMLTVFERVHADTPLTRLVIDHAETISPRSIARLKALGGGVAVQDRMAFAGEYFVERYGAAAAAEAPPLRALVDSGMPVGGGTDATRVSSHNPWVSLAWMVTGKTVGGLVLYPPENRLTRAEALRLYTTGSAWLTGDDTVKGRIAPRQYADFAILDPDFFEVSEDEIARIEAVLTVVAGTPVYAAGPYQQRLSVPELPAVSPMWSPVAVFGGYQGWRSSGDLTASPASAQSAAPRAE